jgi:hypothetical protein
MRAMRPVRAIATVLLIGGLAAAGCAGQPDRSNTATGQSPATRGPSTTGDVDKGEPAVLADGRHPAYLKTVDPDRRRITFDVIQFYVGDDAATEAAKDHQESPPPNDYYIRNVNPKLRTLPLRDGATITVNTLAAGYTGSATKNIQVPLDRLKIMLDFRGSSPPFWITVRHDQIVKLAEQYVP